MEDSQLSPAAVPSAVPSAVPAGVPAAVINNRETIQVSPMSP
jgi:hypothetical protein